MLLDEFLAARPRSRNQVPLSLLERRVLEASGAPDEVVTFLRAEGHAAYLDDFLFTTLPSDHARTLAAWKLSPTKYFPFLRTALGGLCLVHDGRVAQLSPELGVLFRGRLGLADFLETVATMDSFLESTFHDVFVREPRGPALGFDEAWELTPHLLGRGARVTEGTRLVRTTLEACLLSAAARRKGRLSRA